jgi:ATP-dependent Lhr-like helicase
VFEFLSPKNACRILEQAILGAPVFGVRWRWATSRALAVLRRHGGKRVPPHILRMRTDDLLSVVFPMQQACLENVVGDIEIPDHPLVRETMADCMHEFMDAEGLVDVLTRIRSGSISTVCRDTPEPSPLSHEIVNANPYAFLDDVPLEERRTRAVSLPRVLRPAEEHLADDEAVAAAMAELAPRIDTVDELHDLLLTVYLFPENQALQWSDLFAGLVAAGRATRCISGSAVTWAAAERVPTILEAIPTAELAPELDELPFDVEPVGAEAAAAIIVRGRLETGGPETSSEISSRLGIGLDLTNAALAALENDGAILRGHFSSHKREQWVDRRVLARIHRHTIGRLRKSVKPVDPAGLMRFLFRWQRVAENTQLIGVDGLATVVDQLQGFELAAGAWERDVLPARIANYDPGLLDQLCLSGQVAWARLSARDPSDGDIAISSPGKAAPLTLMNRADVDWLRATAGLSDDDTASSLPESIARVREALRDRGALFLPELVKASELEPAQVEDALWTLVACGLATADGFACLRMLIDRRRGEKLSHYDERGRSSIRSSRWQRVVNRTRARDNKRASHAARTLPSAAGRWSLLGGAEASAVDVEATARQLLCRYGVVFRELLGRESSLPPWRDLLHIFRRLENRGEIRGGRFVEGFVGEQFALPEALDGLRASRKPAPKPEVVRLAATDPLNLVGVTSSGARVPAVIGNSVLYIDGIAIAAIVAGELQTLRPLENGASVDRELNYLPPETPRSQSRLPF